MNKAKLLLAAVLMLSAPACAQNDTDVIGKQNIRLTSPTMTPEALWAMGRISSYEASPDGKRIVFQVGYYSVKQNKSHHVLYMMNADGSNRQLLHASEGLHGALVRLVFEDVLAVVGDGKTITY